MKNWNWGILNPINLIGILGWYWYTNKQNKTR